MDVQRAAAYMIESLEGDVVYDFEGPYRGSVPKVRPERELVDRLFESSSPDERPKIIYARLEGTHITDNEMMLLRYLPDLVALSITDGRMARLQRAAHSLPELVGLSANAGTITDRGLVKLEGLAQLRRLWLTAASVRGPGLAHVSKLPLLESLNVILPMLENEGLAYLRSLTHLRILHVSSPKITDEGAPYLAQIPSLTYLGLESTSITGGGLGHLWSCQHLTALGLSSRQLTKEGVEVLKSMPNLKEIFTFPGDLAPELEAELRRARPDLEIIVTYAVL